MHDIKIAGAKKKTSQFKDIDIGYQNPFTALKINNTKKGMAGDQGDHLKDLVEIENKNHEDIKYDDGSLSPILIPLKEAGYLQSLAVTDEKIE